MRRFFARLRDDRRGATAVMVALMIPVLMGAVGMAVDVNLVYLEQHRLQIAADTAAYTAALMLGNATTQAQSPTSYTTIATNAVTGITAGTLIGASLTTAVTVASGFKSVTVVLNTTQPSLFTSLLGLKTFPMQATAQAGVTTPASCILALATTASGAINANNEGSITATNCSVFVNSNSSSAITLTSGQITATSIGVVGGTTSSQGTYSPAPVTGQTAVADPDAGIVVPTYGSCTATSANITSGGSFPPGVYCGATTSITGNIALTTGIYYFINSNLSASNVTITSPAAGGVTWVFTGSAPGALTWSNNSTGTLNASTSGAFNGVSIYQKCPSTSSFAVTNFTGGGSLAITGTIYLPCGQLYLQNNTKITTATTGIATANVVAGEFLVVGSAGLAITGGSATASSAVRLTN